jgi:hypothetical protein
MIWYSYWGQMEEIMRIMKQSILFLLVFILFITACKPGNNETQHQVVTLEPTIVPTDDDSDANIVAKGILRYEQFTNVANALIEVTYVDVPVRIYVNSDHPNKGPFNIEGSKRGEVLITNIPSGNHCIMSFNVETTVTIRGSFYPETCTSKVYVSTSVDQILDRAGTCPPNLHATLPDTYIYNQYYPPLDKTLALPKTETKYSFPVNKNTVMALSMQVKRYPGSTRCIIWWPELPK